jgi:hypothetical protein
MSHIYAKSERVIAARPEEVFAALKDYQDKRRRLLTEHFLNYTVEQGGQGSGTVIAYTLRAGGRERAYRMAVEEPQKGQLLAERDLKSSLITRWSVAPLEQGHSSLVKVESDWEGSQGVGGFFERTFAPQALRAIYKDMLHTLALLTQTPEENRRIMRVDRRSLPTNAGFAMLALSSVVAIIAGVAYLRNHQRS